MDVWQQDWISKWALYSPNQIAISENESQANYTYSQLNKAANQIARLLVQTHQINKGDRVAVLADFSVEFVALMSAAQKAGFVLIPINYRLTQFEVSDILLDADPKMILCQDKYIHLVSGGHKEILRPLEILKDTKEEENDFLNPVREDDSLFIIYTSGTTGKPKGVLYTHKMLFWNSINTALSLKINTDSRTVNVMPPFHTGGLNVLLTPFLHHGGSTLLYNKFEPQKVLEKIAEWKCNIFMGVPTMLAMMASEPIFENIDISCLDYIIVGGESMPIPLIEKYAEKGVAIRQGYGMTEVGPNLTSLHQNDAIIKKGSIGRPNFYVQHKIITEENMIAKPGQSGELWLRGPMVTPGYWNNPVATKDAFSDDGLWFKTGDIMMEDSDKYLYVVDRLKNMFISGAENVYPAEIEKILVQIPQIKESVVIGIKDEKWGEVGKAFISFKPGQQLTEEQIKAFCIEKLAKYKVPKHFVFLDEIPKTDSGKLDRKTLKHL